MKILTKSLLSAGAAAAALVSVAAPAQARGRDDDKISAGEVIAGAVILGGIAAVLASSNDRDSNYRGNGYDDDYSRRGRGNDDYGRSNGYDYRQHGGSRQAVNMCISAAENWAGRYSRSDVTEVQDIDRTRYGYKVTGKIVVRDGWRGRGDQRNGRYDRGYNNGYNRGYDKGRFTCYVERGRVVDVNYRGLDQWR